MKSQGGVAPALHPETEREYQIQQGGCCNGRCAQTHVLHGFVEGPLQHQELLVLRGPREGLPDLGGGYFEAVTWTRFNRCARFAPKYSAAPLFSFLYLTRLFSSRVYLSFTATSLTVSAMQVPAVRLMLWSRLGRWIRSIRWRCWRRSASGRGAEGSGTTSAECVLGPDWTITARSQSMIGRQAALAAASRIAPRRRFQASTREISALNSKPT